MFICSLKYFYMEVFQMTEPVMRSVKNKEGENDSILFERKWQHSISGEEFLTKAHKHIEKLYASKNNRQNGCEVL